MYFQNPNMYQANQFGQPQYGVGVQQMPKAKYTQPLTPEMISKLRSTGDNFEVKVSQEDLWRAACTHKENGAPTLVSEGVNPETGNEILRCTICGETFEMIDYTKEQVESVVEMMNNLLQTSKTMYLDAPAELVKQYYQMIPLLKMFPKLYERSQKNFAMYENAMGITPNATVAGVNGFQMMGNMLANPYAAMGYGATAPAYPQQPWDYAPQQPAAPAYPQQQPWGQPAPVYGNPMMYNSAPVAPAPMPQAPAAGVVPAAPPADASNEVTQQKQFNV